MTLSLKKPDKIYLKVFLTGFVVFYIVMLPMIAYNKGIFLYYGDFNSQQIPFYQLAHNAVRNGNFFWNWNTDLGANFIGSYSFYLLGSPFFWLTIPFPDAAVPYLMPVLLALKYATASLTAFMYIKRFVRNYNAAFIGALLYAFSGFQSYNVFFNHFHDATAFFPLLLIAMEERIQNERKGVFALAVALCAVVSYFFFEGEVIFCIIYFIIRSFSPDFKITPKKFFLLAGEAIIGVMLAAFMLLPSLLAIVDNPRTAERLLGYDLVAYNDKMRLLRIIQTFFMLPDVPARPNLFASETAKWASIGGYLPLFSMAGVIAFMRGKSSHWASRIIKICIAMAFIPVLNSFFAGFTSSYYARWYFMPILIMAMMTAYAIDNSELDLKYGVYFSAAAVVIFAIIGTLPSKIDNKVKWFSLPKYPIYFWITIAVTMACAVTLIILLRKSKRDEEFIKKLSSITIAACFICTATTVWYGVSNGPYPKPFISEAINGAKSISLPESDFYRIDISENVDNYPMSWGIPSMRAFQSVVPASIMEFYPTVGVTRDVASRADTSKFGLRGLFSVKYYFNHLDEDQKEEKELDMPGFEYYDTQNGFKIYENKYYVPMGFTFDYYISEESYLKHSDAYADKILMKAIVLNDEQIEKYSDILKPLDNSELNLTSYDRYLSDCEERAKTACSSFKEDTKGFTAEITLDKDNLVFFSVPYDKGFTASVDGEAVTVEKTDIGFMAVKVPAGEHTIRFNYFPQGLKTGFLITLGGILILLAYLFIFRKERTIKKENHYDYN